METLYDHPLYYDILFGWDRSKEAKFYEGVFTCAGIPMGEPLLEVACGTGQVARRLAHRGWAMSGLDLKPAMLEFLGEEAAREGVLVETICGNMTAFSSETKFAAAYNPMSSFRLLQGDEAAADHLGAVAAALRPGGVYALDMEFLSREVAATTTVNEAWEMQRGPVVVRASDEAVYVDDGGRKLSLPWAASTHLRGYTPSAFMEVVEASRVFRSEAWHPELQQSSDVSEFDPEPASAGPVEGRAMVVLRRIPQ